MERSAVACFTSTYFKVEAGEDEQTNPGVFGRSLARWIADQLKSKGVEVKDTLAEDWGWCVTTDLVPKVSIAVSNVDGSRTRWRVFAFSERGLLGMFRSRGEVAGAVNAMRENLVAILQTMPDISDLTWEPSP